MSSPKSGFLRAGARIVRQPAAAFAAGRVCGRSIQVQQRQREAGKECPEPEGALAAPERIQRAAAARREHGDQPRRLKPQGREAIDCDVKRELGGGNNGKQQALRQQHRTQRAQRPLRSRRPHAGARHQPQQRKIDRHHAAQREKALPRVLRNGIALGHGARERAEKIARLKGEKRQIHGGKDGGERRKDGDRHAAELFERLLKRTSASPKRLRLAPCRARDEAEQVCADRQAQTEPKEKIRQRPFVPVRRQRRKQPADRRAEARVCVRQRTHGQHQQGARRQNRGSDARPHGSGAFFSAACTKKLRQRGSRRPDAQEKASEREHDHASERIERQKAAALAAEQRF